MMLPDPLLSRSLIRRGLEDFDEFDPGSSVETPRSLAACTVEGVRPQDLTFVPPEAFQKAEVPPEVAQLRFEFFESHRQDLLALARAARALIVAGQEPLHSMAAREDPSSQYRHTLEFFLGTLRALDLKVLTVREDWSQDPRSEEFRRTDPYSAGRAASALGQSRGPSGMPAFRQTAGSSAGFGSFGASTSSGFGSTSSGFGSPAASRSLGDLTLKEPSMAFDMSTDGGGGGGGGALGASANSWWACGSSTWRSATSEAALHDMLHQMRHAPGVDWRELEAARQTEDSFGPLRDRARKARNERHSDEQRLRDKRMMAMTASSKSLDFQQKYKDRLRDIRECMSPPVKSAANSGGQIKVRENNARRAEEGETYRRDYLEKKINKIHELEHWLDEDRYHTKMKFAQMTMEDRIRWRHNFSYVEEDRASERAGVLEDFRRKEAQLDAAGQRTADTNALRKELHNLRQTLRVLDEYRQQRKQEQQRSVFADKLRDGGQRRLEETGGPIEVPQWCLAAGEMKKRRRQPPSPLSMASPPMSPTSSATMWPTSPMSPTSPSGRSVRSMGSPKARAAALPDVETVEKLSPEEIEWMRRVTSPKGEDAPSRRMAKTALQRSSTAPRLRAH